MSVDLCLRPTTLWIASQTHWTSEPDGKVYVNVNKRWNYGYCFWHVWWWLHSHRWCRQRYSLQYYRTTQWARICKIDDKVTLSTSNRLRHQTANESKTKGPIKYIQLKIIIRFLFLFIESRYISIFVNHRHLSHINTRDHPYPTRYAVYTITIVIMCVVCNSQLTAPYNGNDSKTIFCFSFAHFVCIKLSAIK